MICAYLLKIWAWLDIAHVDTYARLDSVACTKIKQIPAVNTSSPNSVWRLPKSKTQQLPRTSYFCKSNKPTRFSENSFARLQLPSMYIYIYTCIYVYIQYIYVYNMYLKHISTNVPTYSTLIVSAYQRPFISCAGHQIYHTHQWWTIQLHWSRVDLRHETLDEGEFPVQYGHCVRWCKMV